jgi:hypothetical protein
MCAETAETIASDILDHLARYGSVSFAELARCWPEHFRHGHKMLFAGEDCPNVVIWAGISETGVAALEIVQPETDMHTTPLLTYLADGVVLDLPLADPDASDEEVAAYTTPHFAPCVLQLKGPTETFKVGKQYRV